MDSNQLQKYIIKPTLKEFGLYSESSATLLLGTAAVETDMIHYIHQIEGPAIGPFNMEPKTHMDLWLNFISYKKELCKKIINYFHSNGLRPSAERMIYDLKYATVMCRLHYLRVKESLPLADDIIGMGTYWKRYYNTSLGKGTIEQFVYKYDKYVKGV